MSAYAPILLFEPLVNDYGIAFDRLEQLTIGFVSEERIDCGDVEFLLRLVCKREQIFGVLEGE